MALLGKKDVLQSVRVDLKHHFQLRRVHEGSGFDYYSLENSAQKMRISIPLHLFDAFKAVVKNLCDSGSTEAQKVVYKQQICFALQRDQAHPDLFVITEKFPRGESTGFVTIPEKALPKLHQLLNHRSLKEPNDLLRRMVAYHKLFQFTFSSESDSMTSDLMLRKEVLSHLK